MADIGIYTEKQRKRIEKGITFSVMQSDWKAYEDDLTDIFGKGVTEEDLNDLCKIPQIIKRGKKYQHTDGSSNSVNVINGYRVTVAQPLDYDFTIHIYGRCGVFGYAVEDKDTLPSALQKICNINNKKVRIVNHGLWGADDGKILDNMYYDIEDGIVGQEDVVVLYMAYLPCMDELKNLPILIYDTTKHYHEYLNKGGNFFDRPGHMDAEGYRFIADFLYNKLEDNNVFENEGCFDNKKGLSKSEYVKINELEAYLSEIKKFLPIEELMYKRVGGIVMNCNPFTRGHRYLIENSAGSVDILIVFILEENLSYFSFQDRLQMVKAGTKDLKNVYVIPSGKFIVSAITFPEYFLKEEKPNIKINAADDVEIFGKYIAPALNIKVRFVGTEPGDMVTNQYHQALKMVLPQYGLDLHEVPRIECEYGIVSAKKVRKQMKSGNTHALKSLLPDTTYDYLLKNGFLEEYNEN